MKESCRSFVGLTQENTLTRSQRIIALAISENYEGCIGMIRKGPVRALPFLKKFEKLLTADECAVFIVEAEDAEAACINSCDLRNLSIFLSRFDGSITESEETKDA